MNTPPWLKLVLRELEVAIVLLVDVEAGRAPCGGATFDEQRALVLADVKGRLEKATGDYERRSATLQATTRRRAAAFFGAAFALVGRASGSAPADAPDAALAAVVRRYEGVCN